MTRHTRTLIVLAVAFCAAAASSYGIYRALTSIPVRQVEVATARTVVAAHNMPMGARLTADDVKLVDWPEKTPVSGGFGQVELVVDRGLIEAVSENEPVVDSKLAPAGAGAGLPPSIPPGMRAMSVKVNEVVGVAGFVVPGTRVDVLALMHLGNEMTTKTVVSNVQVLTAGTRYDQEKARKDGKPIPSTVVTLLVSPDDAQRVALAQGEGQVMLALRNPLDAESVSLDPLAASGLFGPVHTAAPTHVGAAVPVKSVSRVPRPVARAQAAAPSQVIAPAPAAPIAPQRYMVEAIRACQRTEEVVR